MNVQFAYDENLESADVFGVFFSSEKPKSEIQRPKKRDLEPLLSERNNVAPLFRRGPYSYCAFCSVWFRYRDPQRLHKRRKVGCDGLPEKLKS